MKSLLRHFVDGLADVYFIEPITTLKPRQLDVNFSQYIEAKNGIASDWAMVGQDMHKSAAQVLATSQYIPFEKRSSLLELL